MASSEVVPTVIRHIPLEIPQRPQRPQRQYRNGSPILLPHDQGILGLQDLPKTPDSNSPNLSAEIVPVSAEIVPDLSTFSENKKLVAIQWNLYNVEFWTL